MNQIDELFPTICPNIAAIIPIIEKVIAIPIAIIEENLNAFFVSLLVPLIYAIVSGIEDKEQGEIDVKTPAKNAMSGVNQVEFSIKVAKYSRYEFNLKSPLLF
jgi:hypothetical protein